MKTDKNKININLKRCEKCQSNKHVKYDFISTNSFMYPNGKTVICRDCTYEILSNSNNPTEALKVFLANINKPFIFSKWNGDLSKYLKDINLRPYNTKTYSDSEFEDGAIEINNRKDTDKTDSNISEELKLFWHGYKEEEIPILQRTYADLASTYPCKTPIQKSIYRNIAATQYLADNAKNPAEFDKLMGTLSKLMNDADIKPVQENETGESDTYGVWIKKIEETEPIPEPLEVFKDPDKIGKYISKWFTSHISRMLGVAEKSSPPDKEGKDNE